MNPASEPATIGTGECIVGISMVIFEEEDVAADDEVVLEGIRVVDEDDDKEEANTEAESSSPEPEVVEARANRNLLKKRPASAKNLSPRSEGHTLSQPLYLDSLRSRAFPQVVQMTRR
jgi:hypothetical protein